MKRLRKMCVTVLVWATAASTLAAGTPHLVCRCPGSPTSLHPGSVAEGSSCCCCGRCCDVSNTGKSNTGKKSSTVVAKATTASCCSRKSGQQPEANPVNRSPSEQSCLQSANRTGSKPAQGVGVDHSRCHKELAQPDPVSLTGQQIKTSAELPSPTVLLLEAPVGSSSSLSASGQTFWVVYRLPPPTDLVTLLQRFTI
jgi:hypothetical protein